MKKLAIIHSFLLSKEQSVSLKLEDQSYLLLLPLQIVKKLGIISDNLSFDLVINDDKLSLIGPSVPNPRVTSSVGAEEIIT